MPRDLRYNHIASEIYPIPLCQQVPRVLRIPAHIQDMTEYNENPLRANFNPGTQAGQKIFLEKTRGPKDELRLDLTATNATKIM